MSLWGDAPDLIRHLADALHEETRDEANGELVDRARRWLAAAESVPRYDERVTVLIDSARQHVSTVAESFPENSPDRPALFERAGELEELLEEIEAGNWPRPGPWDTAVS